jgi:hypothetical protein
MIMTSIQLVISGVTSCSTVYVKPLRDNGVHNAESSVSSS